jgi:hypothetical protein
MADAVFVEGIDQLVELAEFHPDHPVHERLEIAIALLFEANGHELAHAHGMARAWRASSKGSERPPAMMPRVSIWSVIDARG